MAIIRYRREDLWVEAQTQEWEWEEVLSMEIPGRMLDECEARKRIKNQGLIPVKTTIWGIVYDKADAPFREVLKRHFNYKNE